MQRRITITVDDSPTKGKGMGFNVAAQGFSDGELLMMLSEATVHIAQSIAKNHDCGEPNCQAQMLGTLVANALIPALERKDDDHGPLHNRGQGDKNSFTFGLGKMDGKESKDEDSPTD